MFSAQATQHVPLLDPVFLMVQCLAALDCAFDRLDRISFEFKDHPSVGVLFGNGIRSLEPTSTGGYKPEAGIVLRIAKHEDELNAGRGKLFQRLFDEMGADTLAMQLAGHS